jgi:hypothetical protein
VQTPRALDPLRCDPGPGGKRCGRGPLGGGRVVLLVELLGHGRYQPVLHGGGGLYTVRSTRRSSPALFPRNC